jgi:hypothetical protein
LGAAPTMVERPIEGRFDFCRFRVERIAHIDASIKAPSSGSHSPIRLDQRLVVSKPVFAARGGCATLASSTARAGPEADNALTLRLDPSLGADQHHSDDFTPRLQSRCPLKPYEGK